MDWHCAAPRWEDADRAVDAQRIPIRAVVGMSVDHHHPPPPRASWPGEKEQEQLEEEPSLFTARGCLAAGVTVAAAAACDASTAAAAEDSLLVEADGKTPRSASAAELVIVINDNLENRTCSLLTVGCV